METNIQTLTKEKIKLDEPGLYDVIFLNDNITTQQFVTKVLKQIFNKTQDQAEIMIFLTQRITPNWDFRSLIGHRLHLMETWEFEKMLNFSCYHHNPQSFVIQL